MRFIKQTTVCLVFAALAALGVARAQNTTGSVTGTVSDSGGAVVPDAGITLTSNATGVQRKATSSASGDFQFLNLSPGEFTLTVESPGFKRYIQNPVEVQVELTTRLNVAMTVGGTTEEVTVTTQAPIIQTENASLGQVVQGQAVTNMPLNGRNVLALVGLVPGVVPQGASQANLTGLGVFSAGNFQIGGGTANQSSTLFDGAPVNISYGNIVALVPDQDVVQEFRAQTNNNTAEYGMYTGGVINITSKSGGNQIHGTAYEFFRNTVFNSIPYFSKHNPSNVIGKNPYHQNQFGANAGFPIIKNKLFGFFDYQGYRMYYGYTYNWVVPSAKQRTGDFSELTKQLYDPCGGTVAGGEGCPNYTGGPTPFPNNQIPLSRISPVAQKILNWGYWANPTNNSVAPNSNYLVYSSIGGVNNQYSGRLDYSLSDKQHMFGRYTYWKSANVAGTPFNNGLITGTPTSPEKFSTHQLVLGDTYLLSPTLIGDIRVSYLRWPYTRIPGYLGFDMSKWGFNSASQMDQISTLNGLANSHSNPGMTIQGYNTATMGYIFGTNQNYVVAPTISKVWKNHTIKAGADLRRMEMLYFQNNNPGGNFQFDPTWTGNGTTTGDSFASFMLGYMVNQTVTASTVQISNPTYNTVYYQGYFVQDNWQVTPKLTLNVGIRYEIPGVYRERHNYLATFNPNEINPAVTINGGPVKGAYDLVASSQHAAAGLRNEHFTNFSPRIGLSYRLDEKTVIRAGWGKFVIPSVLQFPESSAQSPLTYLNNIPVASQNGGVSPYATLDNPFPNGLTATAKRDNSYQRLLLGGTGNVLSPDEDNGFTYQWNLAVQRQLPLGIALEAAYAGLHGAHLPVSRNMNQVPASVLAQALADPTCAPTVTSGCFLSGSTPNPFDNYASTFNQGTQKYANIPKFQLYRPFPQYGSVGNSGNYIGVSNYNALQMKVEKRFNQGGILLGSYTFSKLMTNSESLTNWLEVVAAPGFQNTNDISGEYALSGYDSRQRLVISYVYNLPIGHGEKLFAGVHGVADKLLSGWGVNGVSTFQKGYPMGVTMNTNTVSTYAGTGTTRPNAVAGVDKKTHGPIQKRLGDQFSTSAYFNLSAFTAPGPFRFGNESRTDNTLRLPGMANWDFALFKDTHLTERMVFQFRCESFNLFNRVQFGGPNSAIGNSLNGRITSQANDPRLLQMAGRINF
jgi:hypothetical protein